MKLHIQEPANGYTVRHVSITDEKGNPVCRIDWQGSIKETNDLAMKIAELWQQRDELLVALRGLRDAFIGTSVEVQADAMRAARAAIAKAGGEV